MPSFKRKDGSSGFHMNPQAAKVMGGIPHKAEDKLEEKISPGIHEKVAEESEKLSNYNGHDFNGHKLAHHVELHHGAHPEGEPPADESHTHHTIAHPHGDVGSEPEIKNHQSAEEAHDEENGAMHEGCPECESGQDMGDGSGGSISDVAGAGGDE